jgi:methionyl-tRNA formyltransferase
MRVGFAGTPAFAAAALAAILDRGFEVPLVLTQPDRPQGRGLKLAASPVKALALARGLPVMQPATLKTEAARAPVVAVPLDVLVVAAYGLILPPEVLAWPRQGCLNVHASLLPRWRGAAPIQRALLAGDAESGITIMGMDAGLDTGPIHDVVRIAIALRETAETLTGKLAAAGAAAVVVALERLARDGALRGVAQPAEGATYAAKVTRAEAAVDWRSDAQAIDRQVRAFDPAPGAFAAYAGEVVKIRAAEPVAEASANAAAGTVVERDARGLVVACGQGALRILELQPAGGKRMAATAYAAGRRIERGARFEAAPVDS